MIFKEDLLFYEAPWDPIDRMSKAYCMANGSISAVLDAYPRNLVYQSREMSAVGYLRESNTLL